MSEKGRSPSKLLVYTLALPVFALVYVTTFGGRLWTALRPTVAAFLGITVISTVYAETAYRRTPTPMRAAAVFALAVTLVAPNVAPAPVAAAGDPAEAVIAAAREYLGHKFQLGAEGPHQFDCSGLVYRAFSDAGQLPRIGGMRLRAAGYMQYFVSRGRFTRQASQADRGDLVVYNRGSHIGIYLGGGKVISALVNPWGVSVHSLHGIHLPVTYFLHVNWGNGDADNGNGNGNGNPDTNPPTPDDPELVGSPGNKSGVAISESSDPGSGDGTIEPTAEGMVTLDANGNVVSDNGSNKGNDQNSGDETVDNVKGNNSNALATGTMNLRTAPDSTARIIGWIGRGGTFKVVAEGTSPGGYLWYQVQTKSGKEGWVYSRWVKLI